MTFHPAKLVLSESEIKQAVDEFVVRKGYEVGLVSFTVVRGDLSRGPDRVEASVTVGVPVPTPGLRTVPTMPVATFAQGVVIQNHTGARLSTSPFTDSH